MSNNIKAYKDQVLKHLHLCGANTALAASLVNAHGEFIANAMERGRPAERIASSIFSTHQLQTVKK
jgi:hypothetical protein